MSSVIGALRFDLGLNTAAFDSGVDKTESKVRGLSSGITRMLGGIAVAFGAAFSVRALATMADGWSEFSSRLTNATGSAEAGAAALDRLQVVARRSYSSIGQTTEAFLSQSTTLNALGVSTATQLDLTEALNNALVISSTRGDKARSVMDAWAKAMALGELRGDDLNSVITNSDRLALALADSMGISVNELRNYGAEGKITREVMLGLTGQLETLRKEAEDMPATIGDGITILGDSILQLVGRFDQAAGVSEAIAGVLVQIGDTIVALTPLVISLAGAVGSTLVGALDILGPSVGIVGAALGGMVSAAVISGVISLAGTIGGALVSAVAALNTVLMMNPILGWIGAISAVVAAVFIFRDQIKQAIGVDVVGVFKDVGNAIIGSLKGAYDAGLVAWDNFPAALEYLAKSAANNFLAAIEVMIEQADELVFGWLRKAADLFGQFGAGTLADALRARQDSGESPVTKFRFALSPQAAQTGAAMETAFNTAAATNYVGQLTDEIGKLWETSDNAVKSINALGEGLGGGDGGSGSGGGGGLTDSLAKALEAMRTALATEEELELQSYEKRIAQIQDFYDRGMIAKAEYDELMERAHQAHSERMTEITRGQVEEENRIRSQLIGHASSIFGSLSTIMANFGEENLALSKAFAVAQAIINTAQGITAALTIPGPLGWAQAAAVAASGAAQISTIMSAQKGGSKRPTVGASGSSVREVPAAPTQQAVSITLQGDYHPTANVEQMIDELLKMQRDGYQIILDRG